MQNRTTKFLVVLGVLVMIARDLWREYQTRHSVTAVVFFACFYGVFWGYCYYCYRKYSD